MVSCTPHLAPSGQQEKGCALALAMGLLLWCEVQEREGRRLHTLPHTRSSHQSRSRLFCLAPRNRSRQLLCWHYCCLHRALDCYLARRLTSQLPAQAQEAGWWGHPCRCFLLCCCPPAMAGRLLQDRQKGGPARRECVISRCRQAIIHACSTCTQVHGCFGSCTQLLWLAVLVTHIVLG